jgi:hypothetical protein
MAVLKARYGGNIIELSNDDSTFPNYNPGNYGTARLKARANSSSVLAFGLTTNTNAGAYCKLKVRVGGQTAYIGRVASLTYSSGETIDYNGSTVASQASETATSISSSDSVTQSQRAEYVSDISEMLHDRELVVYPSSTRTVTYKTISASILDSFATTYTSYSFSKLSYRYTITQSVTRSLVYPAAGAKKTYTQRYTSYWTGNYSSTVYSIKCNIYSMITAARNALTATASSSKTIAAISSSTKSTTRQHSNTSQSGALSAELISATYNSSTEYHTVGYSGGYWYTYDRRVTSSMPAYYRTNTYYASVKTVASYTYWSRRRINYSGYHNYAPEEIQTYYYESTRYTGSAIFSTYAEERVTYTRVSETCHNINL